MNPLVRSIFSASCIALAFDASAFGQSAESVAKAPPSATQQAAMIAEIRQKALDYRRTLPNLLCTQTARRYSGTTQKKADQEETWKLNDTLTIDLSYFEQKDHHQLVKVNGRPAPQSIDNVGGHLRAGDFGSNPASVFAPASQASLHWERWTVLNGRVAAVLAFAIDLDHTPFSSTVQRDGRSVRMKWACKGLVYADAQTHGVLRIAIESSDLHDADWTGRSQVHDYAYQEMGGRKLLLPVESVELLDYADGSTAKVDSQFTGYRPFPAVRVPDRAPGVEAFAKLDGLWLSDGYGWFLEIRNGTARTFELTSISCIPSITLELDGEDVHFTVDAAGNAARIRIAGVSSDVFLRRAAERPKICGEPPADTPQNNYAIFWQTFAENYPFFDRRHMDWETQDRQYRPLVTSTTSPKELFGILRAMVDPMLDGHAHIDVASLNLHYNGRRPNPNHRTDNQYRKYVDIIASQYVRGELQSFCQGKVWFGLLEGSVGYLSITNFFGFADSDSFYVQAALLEDALDQIFRDSQRLKGLIIDMRHNSGGTDGLDFIVPSRLTGRKYVAYSKEARDNPTGPLHFTTRQQAWVNPVDRPGFRGPTILLTGQDCASDCETFVLATMGRQPAIVRIGDPTEGIFSNLLERRLPNGWRFELSNEVFHAMDGRVFEAVGVPPDIAIPVFTREDATNRRDPAIERALTILNSAGQH